jgi:hypothetical protein
LGSNSYEFRTTWRFRGRAVEAARVIAGDPTDLPRWWPSVYLDVKQIAAGEPSGVGSAYELYTKGWLPYRLRWTFRVTEVEYERRIAIEAWGDFAGVGEWNFLQEGEFAVVTYDWQIQAEKPLLRRLSWLLKPLFSANHRWAMSQGLRSLKKELASRAQASGH